MFKSGKISKKEKRKKKENSPLSSDIICPRKIKVLPVKKDVTKKTNSEKNQIKVKKPVLKSTDKKKKCDHKLVIKNLSFEVVEENLKEIFPSAYFISIPKFTDNGKSKGYAFIWYESKADAMEAKNFMNRRKIKSRRISIHYKGTEEGSNQDCKVQTPKKVNLYPNKSSTKLSAPKKQYIFADDSD